MAEEVIIPIHELKEAWQTDIKRTLDKKLPVLKETVMQGLLDKWTKGRQQEWTGCSYEQMQEWIKDGYQPPEMPDIADYTPFVKRRRYVSAEAGDEVVAELAWSGDPTPFRSWEERKRKPGCRIIANMSVHCGTSHKLIETYGAWLAGLIAGMEIGGYDLEVDVIYTFTSLYVGHHLETKVTVRLTDVGLQSDFKEYSPIFSPGGFRMLGFYAMGMTANALKKKLSPNLGYPVGHSWDIDFEEASRTLTINSPNGSTYFPADELTEKVKQLNLV